VTKYATSVFSKKISGEGIDFIDDKELKGKIPAPFNEQLVKDILEQSKCICGARVEEGSEAFENIRKLIAKAADPVLMNRVTRARGQLTGIRKDLNEADREFDGIQKNIQLSTSYVKSINMELEEISTAIKGIDIENIVDKEKERERLIKLNGEVNKRIGS